MIYLVILCKPIDFFLKGKRLFFVTNNSTKTQDDYAKAFNTIGYKAKPVSLFV